VRQAARERHPDSNRNRLFVQRIVEVLPDVRCADHCVLACPWFDDCWACCAQTIIEAREYYQRAVARLRG
jgi:hypothetical protein